ncbi:MAG: TIGR04282 family arsenosugar biosynthesis glycosyltransferase [Desulfotomaculaceae bacterium]
MSKPAIAIMTRVPSPAGKTRLRDILSPERRENLQWAFLRDTLEKVRQVRGCSYYIAATPQEQIPGLAASTGTGVEIIPQAEGDLGTRMLGIIKEMFRRGHAPLLLVGTDVPALTPACLERAIGLLKNCRLVFGPARDGGYYLIGMSSPESAVFQDINWGTGTVLRQTLARCRKNNLAYKLLGYLNDIDRPEDLMALKEHFSHKGLNELPIARHTFNFLCGLSASKTHTK